MRRVLLLLVLGLLACTVGPGRPGAHAEDKKADDKGTVVDFDGLKSRAPAEWKEESAGQFRYMQFKVPKAKDDAKDAELLIFKGFGGSNKDNIARWQAQFSPPEGKKLDDVSKVTEFNVGDAKVTYLDIQGTYKTRNPPNDPKAKEEKFPGYRMLAVIFEGPKTVYHVKLVGPAATVEANQKGFEEWVKGFK
jgi:hypothetical protein